MPGNVHHATLDRAAAIADGVIDYRFTLATEDAALAWRPGQFVSIACGEGADGQPILRSYSLASRPGSGVLRLILKMVPGGAASEWFRALAPGARVRFTGPMGFFVLELSHPGDLVFVATGTGIAPIVPMIEEALARDEAGRVHLHWGLRAEGDLFWRDELAALAHPRLSAHVHLSRASDAWSGERGRVTDPVLALLPSLSRPTFYLCGNGAMIRELKEKLVERGVERKRQIRTEAFFD